MRIRSISVVALSDRNYCSLAEKLDEAVRWVELAAGEGGELVVLPECLNRFREDAPSPAAADDWRSGMSPLLRAAERLGVWVTVPVIHRQDGMLRNSFFLVSPDGEPVWQYDKCSPTPSELDEGIVPGVPGFFDWQGVRLGGAICFDTCFPAHLDALAAGGADLVVMPSLWPGGSQLAAFCKWHASRLALAYPHWSRIIDLDGRDAAAAGYRQETLRFGFGAPVCTARLNFDRVSLYGNGNQEKMAALRARYGRRIQVEFDQENCLWFLESRDPELPESGILREFGLVSAVDYFSDCARRIREARR